MQYDIQFQNRSYSIETNPPRSRFAEIRRFEEVPAQSGIVAGVLRNYGRNPVTRNYLVTTEDEIRDLVAYLGYSYSRSQAWRRTWELYCRIRRS